MSNCQELVHCDAIYNFGCDGELMGYAFEFIDNNGVALILMKTIPTKEQTANVISTGRMPRLLQLMGMKMSLKMMKKHCRRKLLINPLVLPFKLVAIPSRLINRVLLPEDVEQIWIMVLWRLVMALTTGRTTGS